MHNRLLFSLLSVCLLGLAQADDDFDRAVSSVCEYTKANDRAGLRRKLDDSGIELRRTYEDIRCGNDSLLRVAAGNGAVDAATIIITKAGKRALTEPEKDGLTSVQWAQKKHDAGDAATKGKIKPVLELMQSKL